MEFCDDDGGDNDGGDDDDDDDDDVQRMSGTLNEANVMRADA